MTGATWFALTGTASAVLFASGVLLGRTRRSAATGLLVVAALVLVMKSILNWRPDWEYALFPFPDYLFLQSWLAFPLGLFAMGLGVGLLRLKLGDGEHDIRIVDGDPMNLRNFGVPAIVTRGLMHVVTVVFTGAGVTIHDPLRPVPQELTFAEYRRRYSGYAVVVARRQ